MSAGGVPVDRADPVVGDTVRVDGTEWEVTDHSSYWNDGGYRVTEWECQAEPETSYLLKEVADTGTPRWLFTRQIEAGEVTVPGAAGVGEHAARSGASKPAAQLRCRDRSYTHAETTVGTYEEDPGEREAKTTWDYWDPERTQNLAVEVWEDGRVDCYLGRYIEPAEAVVVGAGEDRPPQVPGVAVPGVAAPPTGVPAAKPTATTRPFRVAVVVLPLAYVVPFMLGWPFDRAISLAGSIALGLAWLAAMAELPLTGLAALLAGPPLAFGFWQFSPLGSVPGVALLLGAPVLVSILARLRGGGRAARSARFLAGFSVAAPLAGLGIFHYFTFAPAPHSLGQWLLALGPAGVGLLVGVVIAAILVRPDPTS